MSKQIFSAEFREAIWSCWNQQCFYCKRSVSLEAMQIDHVVPESILNDPVLHAQTLKDYGLPLDFDIQGDGNLAPSCADCNRRKKEFPFLIGQIAIFLAQIKASLPRLKISYERALTERRLSDIMRSITNGFRRNSFTKEELLERIEKLTSIEKMNGASQFDAQRIPLRWLEGSAEQNTVLRFSAHANERLNINPSLVRDLESAIERGKAFVKRTMSTMEDRFEITTLNGIRIVYRIDTNVVTIITLYQTRH